ncbi:Basic-leucine zipper domain [Ostreococcus tauri]|uniref:Basic-leucine zipper domain n=1 Tax=Ostreococcus tauri TaxID=70448 RepID=A0A090M296_OSTTA|nr:Basic-leucine zipper domain [Ostreococcus tauri]CEF98360.1 Basic-leucine zipper domain [Ostreococcus tauri]|eukprot:XP_022839227.1 Basic-leucine zipper domain [Ostreococcus tauri]
MRVNGAAVGRSDADASASASASCPSTPTRTKVTESGTGRDNRAAVRRYRERKRMEERARRAECERLQKENETLRGQLRTTEAELTHTKWLLTVVAWKYDVNLMDIPVHKPSTAMVPMEHPRGDDEDLLRVADEISEKSARITETERPRAPNSKPPISPDELELKDFLEEYFTHGDACPCFDGMDTRELAINSAMCLPAAHHGARRHRGL